MSSSWPSTSSFPSTSRPCLSLGRRPGSVGFRLSSASLVALPLPGTDLKTSTTCGHFRRCGKEGITLTWSAQAQGPKRYWASLRKCREHLAVPKLPPSHILLQKPSTPVIAVSRKCAAPGSSPPAYRSAPLLQRQSAVGAEREAHC